MKILALLCIVALTAGCTSVSPGGYYWGKYSYTYHDMIKEPSDITTAAHKETLRDIIAISADKNLRVPPGIHAELGNLLASTNQMNEAVAEYGAEMALYPESKVFLEKLISGQSQGSQDQ